MNINSFRFHPVVKLSHFVLSGNDYVKQEYYEFSRTSRNASGRNLGSYSFSRSTNNLIGQFSLILTESVNVPSGTTLFMDQVNVMDMVEIYEDGTNLSFVGIVSDINFSAQAGMVQKKISVNGKSIEWLFERCLINFDVSSMAFAQNSANNLDINSKLVEVMTGPDGKYEAASVKKIFKTCFEVFSKGIDLYQGISTAAVLSMIKSAYGSGSFDTWIASDSEDIKSLYPICNSLYQNQEVKFIDFIRYYLPEMVYELFGVIEDNKPKIKFREMPFTKEAWSLLNGGTVTKLNSQIIQSYSVSRNCEQVYTAFFSNISGSGVDTAWVQKAYGTITGYSTAVTNQDKIKFYGYKPFTAMFTGYIQAEAPEEEGAEATEEFKQTLTALNQKLCDWYSNLDEIYQGDLVVVNIATENIPHIGQRVQIGENQFYVVSESHSWSYGQTPSISYRLDRGGKYNSDGSWTPCKNISKHLVEVSE